MEPIVQMFYFVLFLRFNNSKIAKNQKNIAEQ